MKKCFCLLLSLLLAAVCLAAAEESPSWEYPLSPLVLLNSDGYLTLANKTTLLDADYEPNDLVKVTAKRVSNGFELRKEAHTALLSMFSDADRAGYTLYVKSAYRSYQTQRTMYYNRLEKNNGKDDGWVSMPGASDHQTGLGVDVLNYDWSQRDGMNEGFAATREAQWMAAHCHEYGFIIRYLKDKEAVTQINYEPWHLRYVGREAAAYMAANNLCLEEFTEEMQAYIALFESQGGSFKEYCRQLTTLPAPSETGEFDESGDSEVSFFGL